MLGNVVSRQAGDMLGNCEEAPRKVHQSDLNHDLDVQILGQNCLEQGNQHEPGGSVPGLSTFGPSGLRGLGRS